MAGFFKSAGPNRKIYPPRAISSLHATFYGLTAMASWAMLALLVTITARIPAFELMAITSFMSFFVGWAWGAKSGSLFDHLRIPLSVWAVGLLGLFWNNVFYFFALRLAPPVESNLLNYTWPLLIIFMSVFFLGEPLRKRYVIGGLMGLAGTVLITADKIGSGPKTEYIWGYLCGLGAAFSWALYSVLCRRLKQFSIFSMTIICLVSGLLALGIHLVTEETVWPTELKEWLAIVALGLGPLGAANYLWNTGMRQGHIHILSVLSYGIPLVSTLLLIITGKGEFTISLALAAILIVGSAIIATNPFRLRKAERMSYGVNS